MKHYPHILIGILALVIIWQWNDNRDLTDSIATERANLKNAQRTIDNLTEQVKVLEIDRKRLSGQIIVLDREIKASKERITIIQKQKNEKINSVDHLTDSELQQFFASRYNGRNSK